MYATIKTIYHTNLELLKALEKPFAAIEYSTLNEKYNIQANADLPNGVYPELGWIAIGRGGHRGRLTSSGATIIDILQHNIKHASLYEHIPFILREIDDDLSPSERLGYGMRTLIEKNGVSYFAYYLKKINYESSFPVIEELTVSDGEIESTPFVATPSQLNPTPIPYSNSDVNISSGKHISVQSTIEIELTKNDIEEIIAAVEIIYGDPAYATISEIATVTGISKAVDTTLGGVNITYEEVLAAQIANHIPASIDIRFTTESIKQLYVLGNTSPFVV